MSDVLNVARYIVKNYRKNDLTSMKLEKLVYYSQAWSLAFLHKPLFPNEIQAWTNGPVCPDLFKKHRHQFSISKNFLDNSKYNKNNITNNQKIIIDSVIEYYGRHSAWYLSQLTHKELPWIVARNGIPIDKPSKRVISIKNMEDYYSSMIINA